jgi:hypothetical protein
MKIHLLLITLFLSGHFALAQSSPKPDFNQGQTIPAKNSENSVKPKNALLCGNSSTSLRGNGMKFTQNKGQIIDVNKHLRPDILFKGDGGGADVYIRKTGMSYVQSNMGEVIHEVDEQLEELEKKTDHFNKEQKKQELMQKQNFKIQRVDVEFAGSNPNPQTLTADQVEGYSNYYYGHCPQGITNVNSYNVVTQKNIYKNIDVKYYGGKEKGLKYDIVVNPGADPNQIKLKYSGAEKIEIKNGEFRISNFFGEIIETLPKVYQIINGKVVDVKAGYALESIVVSPKPLVTKQNTNDSRLTTKDYIITFKLETYNSQLPLIIDPWATYFGGTDTDVARSITTDKTQGNVLVTGWTSSTNFPILGAFQSSNNGGMALQSYGGDVFVAKLSPAGARIWATYYGGSEGDCGSSIATDKLDNVVITGTTRSSNFPTGTSGGGTICQQNIFGGGSLFVGTYQDGGDAFVLKFDTNGLRLWATYYGGDKDDAGNGIAVDNVGNIVISGSTQGGTFPISAVAQQIVFGGGGGDAFAIKFNSFGARMWGTYYGGNQYDTGTGITIDSGNNIVFTGSASGNFPLSATPFQPIFGGGGGDAFVVKLNSLGTTIWATYFGGPTNEGGFGIAIDNADNIIFTGITGGNGFPVGTSGPPNIIQQAVFGGGGNRDAILVKLDNNGSRLWATYYGGPTEDYGYSLAIDLNNNIFLIMDVEDAPAPNLIDACALQSIFNGGSATNPYGGSPEDQLLVKFTPFGKKICSTYMGGMGEDELDNAFGTGGPSIAIFGSSLYIAGGTDGGYPVTAGAFQNTYAGPGFAFHYIGGDAFIASLCTNICEGTILGVTYTTAGTCPVTFIPTITSSCDTTGYKYQWTFTGGSPASSTALNPLVSFGSIGNHDVKLVVTTICKKDSITIPLNVATSCVGCALSAQYIKGTATCSTCGCKEWIMVNAKDGTPPYSYSWPAGYDKRYQNKLCSGTYTIKVTDKNGCSVNVGVSTP